MKNLITRIDRLLSEDRASLSDFEIMVLEDSKELGKQILKMEDGELKNLLLLELTIKILAFFGKSNFNKTSIL
jgi:hypothetical protein